MSPKLIPPTLSNKDNLFSRPSSASHEHKDSSVTSGHSCPESPDPSGPAAAHPASSVMTPPGAGSFLPSELKTLNHLPQIPKCPETSKDAPPLPCLGPEIQAAWSCQHLQGPLFCSDLRGPRNHIVQGSQDLPGHRALGSSEIGDRGHLHVPLSSLLLRRGYQLAACGNRFSLSLCGAGITFFASPRPG